MTVAEIGKLVQTERRRQGVTQMQLAGLAGTGIRFVSDLENGKGTIQVQNRVADPVSFIDRVVCNFIIGNGDARGKNCRKSTRRFSWRRWLCAYDGLWRRGGGDISPAVAGGQVGRHPDDRARVL